MDPLIALAAALVGYLLGAVSFARVIAHLVSPGRDIRDYESPIEGSSHTYRMQAVSATTVGMQLGNTWGAMVGVMDILKVAAPALVFRLMFPDQVYHLIVAVLGLVGHNWPVYYGFKGGRGLSAIYGGFLVADPIGMLVTSALAMTLGMFVLKIVIFGYLGGITLMIPWMAIRWRSWPHIVYVLLINIIFVVGMIPDIKAAQASRRDRMAAGEDVGDPWEDRSSPMGRMMTRWGERRGILKDREKAEDPSSEAS